MTKRITADHVKLKRAYEPAAANEEPDIDRPPVAARSQESRRGDRSMGQGYRARAPPCENGSVTTLTVGRSFAAGTLRRSHQHPEQLSTLRTLARQGPITLVFSAHDELHNDAVALRDFLLGRNAKRKAEATHR